MALWDAGAQPLALRSASAPPGHVGRRTRLVDADQPFRIEVGLALKPVLAPLQDIGAILLGRVGGLFLRKFRPNLTI